MFGWMLCYATTFVTLNWLNHATGLHADLKVTATTAAAVAATLCWVANRFPRMPLK